MRNESALNTPPEPVAVEVDGRTYEGTYRTGRGFVMLTCDLGNCFAPRGRMAAQKVAALLLRKLAEGAAKDHAANEGAAAKPGP